MPTEKTYYEKNQAKLRKYARDYRKNFPSKKKNSALLHAYGITLKQHKQMYIDQNGCCAICKKPVEYNNTNCDHDHATGKVRGLLCRRCNIGMAYIDDTLFLEEALNYTTRV